MSILRTVLYRPWPQLVCVAIGELCAMGLWFSASAVVPQLTAELRLSSGEQALLTISVQLGFVAGALASAIWNLPERWSARRLFAASALLAALSNLGIVGCGGSLMAVLVLRGLTGVALAGVYPVGMKLMATWFARGRGLAIGVLVGALSIGSGVPHLLNAVERWGGMAGIPDWRGVLVAASALAAGGALFSLLCVRAGPHLQPAAGFRWSHATEVITNGPVRLANFAYLGHMWELYAMWTWGPAFLRESFVAAGRSETAARLAGFLVLAAGGFGCVLAGLVADRIGRTTVAIVSLAISGSCALVAGFLGSSPLALAALMIVWGIFVVADSAQFSAAISELCDPRYVGTALSMQTCLGFLLTIATIRLVPWISNEWGWGPAFALLSLGPAAGIWSLYTLRSRPEALKMAGGRR